MESLNYITIEGERIDSLATKFYGSNAGIQIIADANQNVPLDAVFPIGTVLIIPIIEYTSLKNNDDLPPWKK